MENIFPRTVMVIATGLCAYLPVREMLNRRLRLRKDVLLILFWYQSWVYLHVIPTINGLFPESTFAVPASYSRVIQFTPSDVAWYAVFQVMIFFLFYLPLMYLYERFRGKAPRRHLVADPARIRVRPARLMGLAIFYTVFGAMFYEMALRTGLVSPYANSIEVLGSLSRYDHWVWRMYIITAPFLFTILMLGCRERPKWFPITPFFIAVVGGVVLNLYWILSSSRTSVAFLIMGVGSIFTMRGKIQQLNRRTILGMIAAALLFYYGLNVIPKFRAIVLDDGATAEDYAAVLNPFDARNAVASAGGGSDYGTRLDGLELMVLAAPKMIEIGPIASSKYALAMLSPIIPLIPSLERRLKFEEQSLDLKQYIMAQYTDISSRDYPSGALVDVFMALGPLGFFVAAATYGWLFAWLRRLIVSNQSGPSLVLGVFLYYNVALYEFGFASLPLGWVRGLPILLVALLLNPFHVRKNGTSCSRARLASGPPAVTT